MAGSGGYHKLKAYKLLLTNNISSAWPPLRHSQLYQHYEKAFSQLWSVNSLMQFTRSLTIILHTAKWLNIMTVIAHYKLPPLASYAVYGIHYWYFDIR